MKGILILLLAATTKIRRPLKSGEQGPRQCRYVEAGVVVSAPRAMAVAAAAHPPHLSRSLFRSAGEVIAVRAVLSMWILAAEAAFGGVGFVDVEDVEAITKKQFSEP